MSKRLTDQENDVLIAMHSDEEMCINYGGLEYATKIPRKYLEPIIKHLKELEYIEFWRGLMDDDGKPAGSGWCRSRAGNDYVEEHQL